LSSSCKAQGYKPSLRLGAGAGEEEPRETNDDDNPPECMMRSHRHATVLRTQTCRWDCDCRQGGGGRGQLAAFLFLAQVEVDRGGCDFSITLLRIVRERRMPSAKSPVVPRRSVSHFPWRWRRRRRNGGTHTHEHTLHCNGWAKLAGAGWSWRVASLRIAKSRILLLLQL
jgi:hypothetical protein